MGPMHVKNVPRTATQRRVGREKREVLGDEAEETRGTMVSHPAKLGEQYDLNLVAKRIIPVSL